jgi:hypothetical protein
VPSPPAWRRPVELGSTGHAVMVGNECVALLAHVLLAICDQTLLAVCVKAGLIPKTRGFVDPARIHCSTVSCIFPQKEKPHFSGGACGCSQKGVWPKLDYAAVVAWSRRERGRVA